MEQNELYYYTFETVLGEMTAVEENGALVRLDISEKNLPAGAIFKETPLLKRTEEELREYLSGTRRSFDLPLNPKGTDFQRCVWQAMCAIDYGETKSYGELAADIGRPKAMRAVGGACHVNSIPIIIPCHRVVAKVGLGGFGLGTDLKKILLKIENPGCEF